MRRLTGFILVLSLAACSSGRYSMREDAYPDGAPADLMAVPDAVPKVEPRSRGGNARQYEVRGKTYFVMNSADGYKEKGGASFYGQKFHGHLTSNGETYDMYAMSAAHKTLPLPTYVRVTRLDNGKSVVLRVNDRGPFHPGRIIDLSYTAAVKLDMLGSGVAQVEVVALDPRAPVESADDGPPRLFLEIAVMDDPIEAIALREQLKELGLAKVEIRSRERVDGNEEQRVIAGPFPDRSVLEQARNRLETHSFRARPVSE